MNHRENCVEVDSLTRSQTEQFIGLLCSPYATGFWFQGPQPCISRVRSQAQARLTISKLLLGVFAVECVCKYLRDQLEAFLQRFGPSKLLACGIKAQNAKHRTAARRKWDAQS